PDGADPGVLGGDPLEQVGSPAADPDPAATAFAADAFGRSVGRGWGTADLGGAWALVGPSSSFSVAAGVGRMTLPRAGAGLTATLPVSSTSTDLTARIAPTRLADGGGVFASLLGRRVGAADYRAKVKVAPSGAVTLYLNRNAGAETTLGAITVPGVRITPGDALRIRLTVTGTSPTTLQARAWEDGNPEPTGWQLTAADATPALQTAGGVGVMTYLSASSTSAPLVVAVDDLLATPVDGPPPVLNEPPAPAFVSTVDGLTATFDATGTTDADGSVVLHGWDFGDGTLGTGATPTHAYAAPGTYSVTLTATDDDGDAASVTHPVTVGGPPPTQEAPVARFDAVLAGLGVEVDGSSSSDADGSVTGWEWDFGDGSTASGPTASHTYAVPGEYTIMLVATDDDGLSSSASRVVLVDEAPVPAGDVARDDFARDVVGGWGTATTGGAWTLAGPASAFSTADGQGRMTLARPGAGVASSLDVAVLDTDVRVTVAATPVADGGGTYVSVAGRRTTAGDQRAKVRVGADGAVTLQLTSVSGGSETTLAGARVPGLLLAAGERLHVRLQLTGTAPTTLRARVWAEGTDEPTSWQVSATDETSGLQQAGGVALVAYVSGSATTTPVLVAFDDLAVGPAGPVEP
ncbi:PKD domain-containing protein, partial [Actinotalea sp. AC32]|nr:PKD domain-containing protein [Actinotalea sp. AC32]